MIHNVIGRYILTVLLALDQLVNALIGGYADETLSYRIAIAAQEGKQYGCVLCKLIELVIPGHCSLEKPSKAARLSRGATFHIPTQGGV
jgi:hypothetical protein